MILKLLTEHHFEFLSLKGGCIGSSESTHDKLLEISCTGSIALRRQAIISLNQLAHDMRITWHP